MALNKREREAMRHPDVLGAGAAKRRAVGLKGKEKVHVVMSEYKRGTLRSGSGRKVKNRKQAIAIAMSEAGMSKVHGLGEAIENTGGTTGLPKDPFSHNVNDKASEKPRGVAIDSPKYES